MGSEMCIRDSLTGAARTIDRLGYGAATVDEIVKECGATKGALYFHFSSKEEVASAIITEQAEWLATQHEDSGHPIQSMVDISFRFVDALLSDPLMRASIRMTIERGSVAPAASMYETWADATERYLREAKRHGVLVSRIDIPRTALTITSGVSGLQMTTDALNKRESLPEALSAFWGLILPGLVGERTSQVDVRPHARRRRRKPGPRV